MSRKRRDGTGRNGLFQTQVIWLETKLEETPIPRDPMTWKWLTRTPDGQSAGRLSQVVQMSGVKQAQWHILHVSSATRWLTLAASHPLGMSVRDFVDLLSEVRVLILHLWSGFWPKSKKKGSGAGIHFSAS